MSLRFQYMEILQPIVRALMFGLLGAVPLFWAGHWFVGSACTTMFAFLLYSARSFVMYLHAFRESRGSLYISPSVDSSAQLTTLLLWVLMTSLYFVLVNKWTGFLGF